MRKLTRPIEPPLCLAKYDFKRDNWGAVTSKDKRQIREALNHMQGERCAYCEVGIITKGKKINSHIEHFRQRRPQAFPQLTFDWNNLFNSCDNENSCGKHKDKIKQYNDKDVLKPDLDDPCDYFLFLHTGEIVPKQGLTSEFQKRATETLRVFNLNGALRKIREVELIGYLDIAEEIAELALVLDEQDWRPELDRELESAESQPFSTAIKQVLLSSIP